MSTGIALKSSRGYGLLVTSVLGSGMAFLDGTAVNVALPALQRSFSANLSALQWTMDAYLLLLSALLLVGGSLGDRYGRKRVFLFGVLGFTAASVACGLAPGLSSLIAARALQGAAAALLVPGSLALMRSAYREEDQGTAIGIWSGLSGVTTLIGPLLGGWLTETYSWRAIFFLNIPLAMACILTALRCVPESRAPDEKTQRLDWEGAILTTVGLGGLVYALIEGPRRGVTAEVLLCAGAGAAALVAFVLVERRHPSPMLPLHIFRSRQFTGANATTLVVYAALSGSTFILVLYLQMTLGYSALAAGLSLTPITLLMLVLSPAAAKVGERTGYRGPMTLGCALTSTGLILLGFAGADAGSFTSFLPGLGVFGLGLSCLVAPLTTAVLSSLPASQSGIASGTNNAIARLAGLLAIAALPALAGLSLNDASIPKEAYERSMRICAALCALGALISYWTISPRPQRPS
jgi:EmrB/QacA subfamily drug resistance transporter